MSPLMYCATPLDRCSNERKNKHWLKQQFNSESTLFCLMYEGNNLFSLDDSHQPIFVSAQQLPAFSLNSCIFLGKEEQRAIFTINCAKFSDDDIAAISKLGQWLSLRDAITTHNPNQAATLALAKALIHWHSVNLYCSKCASHSQSVDAGHARRCTNNQCRNMSFPRTDPAVIMLVEKMFDDGVARCLLARQESWPKGMFSTLAGFVDPGETIEQTVIREVLEESNIQVINPQYIRSQPWPFPASVMLGFTATAINEDIDISQDDLHDAQWFSRDDLANFATKEEILAEDYAGYRISSADSISSYLITAWKNREIGQC